SYSHHCNYFVGWLFHVLVQGDRLAATECIANKHLNPTLPAATLLASNAKSPPVQGVLGER
ncbi:hypothetical protein, partial [Psychrobacter sp. TB20-MNA-CIBAN-0197]|uniref:hypothetical protein n=1 Tax=Psychrobacter sp. TB20-MNA-CIBAN-0197 TaxID=3140453 RepID=UPI00331F48F6